VVDPRIVHIHTYLQVDHRTKIDHRAKINHRTKIDHREKLIVGQKLISGQKLIIGQKLIFGHFWTYSKIWTFIYFSLNCVLIITFVQNTYLWTKKNSPAIKITVYQLDLNIDGLWTYLTWVWPADLITQEHKTPGKTDPGQKWLFVEMCVFTIQFQNPDIFLF
jgi:hypothetical protein